MKTCGFLLSALPLALLAFAAAPAAAQDKSGTNRADTPPASIRQTGADTLTLGYRLVDHARTTKDARAMIVAARIVESVAVRDGTDKGRIEGVDQGTGEAKAVTAAELFAEARQMADGDADIIAAIEEAQAEASRGVPIPAFRTVQYVPEKTTWTVRFNARGGEPLVVGARRDTAVPVDMKVYDENGHLVCQDVSRNVTMYCRIEPIWTGVFSVRLTNHGEQGTGLALVTN